MDVQKKFSRIFENFQTEIAQARNIQQVIFETSAAQDATIRALESTGVVLTPDQIENIADEVDKDLAPQAEDAKRKIHGQNEADLISAYKSIKEGGDDGAIRLYQELMRNFFHKPNLPSATADAKQGMISTRPSLTTPTDSNFIFFDDASGEFKCENENHDALVAMANDLKARTEAAWNKNTIVKQYQEKVAAATSAAKEIKKDNFVAAYKNLTDFCSQNHANLRRLSDKFDGTGHYLGSYIDMKTAEELCRLCKAAGWGDSAQNVVEQSDAAAAAAETQRKAKAASSSIASAAVPVAARPLSNLDKQRALALKFDNIARRYGDLKGKNSLAFAVGCVSGFKEMLNIIYPNAKFRSDSGRTSLMDNVELGELANSAFMKWDTKDQKFVSLNSNYENYAAIANGLLEQMRDAWEKYDTNVLGIKDMIPDAKKALAEGNITHSLVICREIAASIERLKHSANYDAYCLAGCSISALTEELNSSFSNGVRNLQEYLENKETTVISKEVAAQAREAIMAGKVQVVDASVKAAELKQVAISEMEDLRNNYDRLKSKGEGTNAYVRLYSSMRRCFFSDGKVEIDMRNGTKCIVATSNTDSLDTPMLPEIFFYDREKNEFVGHGSPWDGYVAMANALKKKTDEAHANEPAFRYVDELRHNNVLENALNKVLELRSAALGSNDKEKAKKYENIFRAMCLEIRVKVESLAKIENISYGGTGYGPVHATALFPELERAFTKATPSGSEFRGVEKFTDLLKRNTAFKAGEILDAAAKDSKLSEVMGKFAAVGEKFPNPVK
jgi:hypothetical protein